MSIEVNNFVVEFISHSGCHTKKITKTFKVIMAVNWTHNN